MTTDSWFLAGILSSKRFSGGSVEGSERFSKVSLGDCRGTKRIDRIFWRLYGVSWKAYKGTKRIDRMFRAELYGAQKGAQTDPGSLYWGFIDSFASI